MAFTILLSTGERLNLTAEQETALEEYLIHPSTQIPVWEESQGTTILKPRWKTTDDWIEYVVNLQLDGVFATCKPQEVAVLQTRIDALEQHKRDLTKATKSGEPPPPPPPPRPPPPPPPAREVVIEPLPPEPGSGVEIDPLPPFGSIKKVKPEDFYPPPKYPPDPPPEEPPPEQVELPPVPPDVIEGLKRPKRDA